MNHAFTQALKKVHAQATKITAAARPLEEVIQSIHLMPNVSIPKAFHEKLKSEPESKVGEGFFYIDGTITARYLEMLKRHHIEVTHIGKGKEGHDFTLSYKVL